MNLQYNHTLSLDWVMPEILRLALSLDFSQIIAVAIGCLLKPVVAVPAAAIAGAGFLEISIGAILGGCSGIFLFMFGLEYLTRFIQRFFPKKHKPSKQRQVFTRRNRLIVVMMQKYGLPGIAAITPLLSLPLGVFIAERIDLKFIKNRKKVLLYLCFSMVCWSFILTAVSMFIGKS